MIIVRFIRWLIGLFPWGRGQREQRQLAVTSKTINTLLIYPKGSTDVVFNETTLFGDDRYFLAAPWTVDGDKVNQSVRFAEDWLAEALGTRIPWQPVLTISSQRSVSEWLSEKIYLIKDEVELLGLPWTEDYIYLAFVRGMGGYAGGICYQDSNAGYAMVGDICLEAICQYSEPTSGSVLLGGDGWPTNSYGPIGQTGAFIHEALHGLGLPHPCGWPEDDQPQEDETLMGHWWNMPNFTNTRGLTQREIARVLEWVVKG